jgi:hypothetical protein
MLLGKILVFTNMFKMSVLDVHYAKLEMKQDRYRLKHLYWFLGTMPGIGDPIHNALVDLILHTH